MLIDTDKIAKLAALLDEADEIGIDALMHSDDHRYLMNALGELIDKNTEMRDLI